MPCKGISVHGDFSQDSSLILNPLLVHLSRTSVKEELGLSYPALLQEKK